MAHRFGGGLRLKRLRDPALTGEPLSPESITLSLAPSRPLAVCPGDPVGRGGLVAPAFDGAAAVYSGISGRIRCVQQEAESLTVILDRDALVPKAAPLPPVEGRLAELSADTLRTLLTERGVTPPASGESAYRFLLVNGIDDDPFTESRSTLCRQHAGDVVGGAKILMKLLAIRQATFVLSKDRPSAAEEISAYVPKGSRMLRVQALASRYPQADPRMLISSLFNLEISPALPLTKTAYCVVTPMLCKAVFDALAKGIPYTDATVTLAEEPLTDNSIGVVTVPFGTAVSQLPSLCGRPLREHQRLTVGGGFRAVPADEAPFVTPETEAVSLLAVPTKRRFGVCIGCGRCGNACPIRLSPAILYETAMADRHGAAKRLDIDACLGCGSCTASCPAGLPLSETIRAYRSQLTGGSDEGSRT